MVQWCSHTPHFTHPKKSASDKDLLRLFFLASMAPPLPRPHKQHEDDPAPQQQHRRSRRSRNAPPRPLLPLLLLLACVAITSTHAFLFPSPPLSPAASPPKIENDLLRRSLFGKPGRSSSSSSSKPSPFAPELMVTYDDNVFAKVWIFLFSGKIAAVVGAPAPRSFIPYEEYVRLSQLLLKGGSTRAKGAVLAVLRSIAFPGFSSIFRTLFPVRIRGVSFFILLSFVGVCLCVTKAHLSRSSIHSFPPLLSSFFQGTSRFACEFNAKVTPVFFSWLVGPAVVEETEMIDPKTYVFLLVGSVWVDERLGSHVGWVTVMTTCSTHSPTHLPT